MSGLIAKLIRESWGHRSLQRIEKRLFERYELSLEYCLFEFEKVDEVIHEFLGDGAKEGLEQRFLKTWSRKYL
ncbi:MAG TPA: hypothetical protein VK431_02390 [Nitrosopumilaceae archaeon]|nr:hypothetical protein [Nitrosopumilaceae archaeon]